MMASKYEKRGSAVCAGQDNRAEGMQWAAVKGTRWLKKL
jgi:hypothetical protein